MVELSGTGRTKAALAAAHLTSAESLTADVKFAMDENGEVIVQIVDSRTQAVVRQLSSDVFHRLRSRVEQQLATDKGRLFDALS